MPPISYARHQFPPEVIQHAVWLYLRFTLSFRDVEDLLAERGLDISYETVRRWVLKFGRTRCGDVRLVLPSGNAGVLFLIDHDANAVCCRRLILASGPWRRWCLRSAPPQWQATPVHAGVVGSASEVRGRSPSSASPAPSRHNPRWFLPRDRQAARLFGRCPWPRSPPESPRPRWP
jgi:hypothetical protein